MIIWSYPVKLLLLRSSNWTKSWFYRLLLLNYVANLTYPIYIKRYWTSTLLRVARFSPRAPQTLSMAAHFKALWPVPIAPCSHRWWDLAGDLRRLRCWPAGVPDHFFMGDAFSPNETHTTIGDDTLWPGDILSGNLLHSCWILPFLLRKLTINGQEAAMLNYQRVFQRKEARILSMLSFRDIQDNPP